MRISLKFPFVWLFSLLTFLVGANGLCEQIPHYLYKVEFGGHTSWLFGTQHQEISFSDFKGMREIFAPVRTVILEKHLPSFDYADIFDIAPNKFYSGETDVTEAIGSENVNILRTYFQQHHGPRGLKFLDGIMSGRPGFLAYVLDEMTSPLDKVEDDGVVDFESLPGGDDILDIQIGEAAAADGKILLGIEDAISAGLFYAGEVSYEDLRRIISEKFDPTNSQVTLLSERLAEYARVRSQYLNGDLETPDFSGRYELIGRRDEAWRGPMLREFSKGPTFLAVGVGHVIREGGLLDFLKTQEGVEVTPYLELYQHEGETPPFCKAISR